MSDMQGIPIEQQPLTQFDMSILKIIEEGDAAQRRAAGAASSMREPYSIEAIAREAGQFPQAVKPSLDRLTAHGLLTAYPAGWMLPYTGARVGR